MTDEKIKAFLDFAIEKEYDEIIDKHMKDWHCDHIICFTNEGVTLISHRDFYVQ